MGSSRRQSPPATVSGGDGGGGGGGQGGRRGPGRGRRQRWGERAAGGRRAGLARWPRARPWVRRETRRYPSRGGEGRRRVEVGLEGAARRGEEVTVAVGRRRLRMAGRGRCGCGHELLLGC